MPTIVTDNRKALVALVAGILSAIAAHFKWPASPEAVTAAAAVVVSLLVWLVPNGSPAPSPQPPSS